MGTFNPAKAAKWARDHYNVAAPTDVPPWGYRARNDCTNFISEALYAGGWEMVMPAADEIPNSARTDDNFWYVAPDINYGFFQGHRLSWSWTAAPSLADFAIVRSKRAKVLWSDVGITLQMLLALRPGDVMQTRDQTKNDSLKGIENLTHTAMVVAAAAPSLVHESESSLPVLFESSSGPDARYGILAQHQDDCLRPLTRWLVRFKNQSICIWRPLPIYPVTPPAGARFGRPEQLRPHPAPGPSPPGK